MQLTGRTSLATGLVVAALLAGLVGCSSSHTDAERVLPLFAEPANDQDGIPEVVGFEARADLSNSRFVGDSGEARYWAAIDSSGNVCLVAIRVADPPSAAAACVSPDAFVNGGVSIEIDLSGESATLAPEKTVSDISSPNRVVGRYLYVRPG